MPEATIACGGHPLPFLVREGMAEQVGRPGPMLGAYGTAAWEPVTVTLLDGDVLVLYTDGVLDTLGEHDRFGEERLRETLADAAGADDAVTRIDAALDAFQVGAQADDTAVLAVARTPVRSFRLIGDSSAPRRARNLVAAQLEALLDPDNLYDVRVLVSELVTNAVRHGGADAERPLRVELLVDESRLRISVWDPGRGFPRPDSPTPRPEGGGNGLLMVDRIASRWDVQSGDGTCVWFELDREISGRASARVP
jgi:anti-sigma regulatory factor (Ser/Thr protein kinase)